MRKFIYICLAAACFTSCNFLDTTVYDEVEQSDLYHDEETCLTGLAGIYDKLGRFVGAGSTVPITGFSNAVVAPAIEFKSEGLIYGVSAKMFTIAGPVIVNGIFSSAVIAIIYLILGV